MIATVTMFVQTTRSGNIGVILTAWVTQWDITAARRKEARGSGIDPV